MSAEKKLPIRIYFVASPLPLFWMLAYRAVADRAVEEVFVSVCVGSDPTTGRPPTSRLIEKLTGRFPLERWEPDTETRYTFSIFRPRSVLRERRRKKKHLSDLASFLRSNGLETERISEIWYSQVRSGRYAAHLFPAARSFLFDHGMGDPPNLLESYFPLRTAADLWRELKLRLRGRLGRFDSVSPHADSVPTIFAEAMRKIARRSAECRFLDIPARGLESAAEAFGIVRAPPDASVKRRVLLLLPNISHLGLSQGDEGALFRKTVDWVQRDAASRFGPGVDLYLKSRSDFSVRYEASMKSLAAGDAAGRIRSFEAEFGEVPVLEPFLASERFLAIYAGFSAALFYARGFDPRIEAVTIHEVVASFLTELGGKAIPDYRRLDDFYYRKYAREFAQWLPAKGAAGSP
jgi:hypothetical protein